jgi:hypothetical protein
LADSSSNGPFTSTPSSVVSSRVEPLMRANIEPEQRVLEQRIEEL